MNPREFMRPIRNTKMTFHPSMMRKTKVNGRGPKTTLVMAPTGRNMTATKNMRMPSSWISDVT